MTTLTIIPVAAAAYIATNLDNFTLLVSLLVRYRTRAIVVSAGFVSSMILLLIAGFLIGTSGDRLPSQYLGLLGVIPLSIGFVGLWRLVRSRPAIKADAKSEKDSVKTVFITSFLSQIGNGADTVITFSILFADSTTAADSVIVATLLTIVGIFLSIAIYGIRHPAVSDMVDRYANKVTPFLLMFVGLYVILNTATDLMPDI